jgi:polyisoprenoid-binding protein YceI
MQMKSLMKNVALVLLLTAILIQSAAQYKPVDERSFVHFKAKTFGINVNGAFTGIDGTIVFDLAHLNDSKFDVSIDANSVNTDNSLRDGHLKNNPFFDVKNYPRIHFVSTRIATSSKKGILLIYGKLSIKKQTRDISFPFTAEPSADSYMFKGTFTINRKDFEVGETSVISDNVEVSLNVFASKQNL